MKKWFNRLSALALASFLFTTATVFAADPDFSTLGAVSDNAFYTNQARNGDTVTFTLTINVAEDSDGTGQVTFDIGAATGLTATFPAAGASTTHTATYAVPAGQDGAISVTNVTFTNTSAESLINTPGFPHAPTPNVTLDNTDPRITTIIRQNPVISPTNSDTVIWRVTLDELSRNLDPTDFTITGTTGTVTSVVPHVPAFPHNIYDVTVTGGDLATLNGTITLGIAGGQNILDAIGNPLTNTTPTTTNDNTYLLDNTAPTVSENTAVVTPGNDTTPDVTINTDEAGTLSVGGSCGTSSSTSLSSGNTTITLTQTDNSTPLVAGTYADCTVTVTDAAGNSNVATALTSFTVDLIAPTVSENTAVTTPTMDTTPDVTINTDEAGTLIMGGSCGTSSSTTLTSGNTTITLTQTDNLTPLTAGTYSDCTVQITDAAGNVNTATVLTAFEVDNGQPDVTSIVRNTPTTSPTNADTLIWRVTFSEAVQNVDAADFSITGTTATLAVATVSADVYDISASGGNLASLNATPTLTIAGGNNITDLASNTLSSATPTGTNDNTFVVDNTAATVTENTAVSTPTMDTTPDVIINTDEAGTLTMGGSCGTSSSTTLGTGNTTITLTQTDNTTPLTAGTYSDCTVQITDAAGNANAATALTAFNVDNGQPDVTSVVRQAPATSPTNADTLVWRVSFSEDVQNVDAADFSILGTTATLAVATVSADVYDVTASGGDLATLNTTATLNFAGGQNITDLASNTLSSTTPTGSNNNSFVVDNTDPTVTETTAVGAITSDSTPDVVLNTDETGTLVIGGACGTSSSTTIGTTGDFTITLTQPDNVTPLADNPGGSYACTAEITDAAGNTNISFNITSFEVDTTAPIISEVTGVSNPTTDNTPDYTFTSDEVGTISYGGNCSSVTTAGTTGNNTVTFNTLADATHSNCTVQVTDDVGNASNVINLAAFRVDTQAPSVQSATVATSGNPGFARETQTITFSVTFNEAVTVTAVNNASSGTAVSTVTNEFDAAASTTDQLIFTVQAGENGTVVPVVDFDIQDAAGLTTNITSLGTITGTVIEVDTMAPTLTPVSIASNNADTSLASTGDNVIVSFTGSETLTAVSGTIFTEVAATANPSGDNWTLTLMTSGDETEGLAPFTADFSDEAGNVGTQVTAVTNGSSVTYDNSPAAVSSVTIASNNTYVADSPTFYARATQTITVTIDPTEDIQTPSGTILGLTPVFTNTTGDIWTATVTTAGGETEGTVAFSLDIQDLAGSGTPLNITATTNGSSVVYDTTAPTNPSATLDGEGVETGGSKPTPSAVFNWLGDADALTGVGDFLVRFENTSTGINQSATVTLPVRDFTPAAVIPSSDPYSFYINTRDKAGNEAGEVLVYTQRYAGLLSGTILDEKGAPLEGVLVNVIAKFDEYCGANNQQVCSAGTDANGYYEMPIVPNQTYTVDFMKLPQYKINKQTLNAGSGDLSLSGQMSLLEGGFVQTGNQAKAFTLNYEGETLTVTVHSFSGEATATQSNGGVEFTSFGRIVLIETSLVGVNAIAQGSNVYRVEGATLQGSSTGSSRDTGIKRIVGSSSGGGFSGMTRAENAAKGRVLTPEESMAFIKTLNDGRAGQTLYYTNYNGKQVFAGYVKGRLAMVVYQKNAKTPVVYRGYRRQRQSYDEDQASVNQNQVAINEAINKNKMLKNKKPKSVSMGNRYESLRRKRAHNGESMTALVNRKRSSRDIIASMRHRDQVVAAKQNKFVRSNGFTQTESRISKNRQAKEAQKLEIIKSKHNVAMILREIKAEQMEALSYSR